MTTISRGLTARRGVDAGLRLIAGVGLLVSAYIHLHRAPGYSLVGDQITEGALFRAQALAAGLAGLALLVRRHRLAWAPAVLVAAGSLVVLVGTVYVNVPAWDRSRPSTSRPGSVRRWWQWPPPRLR